MLSVTSRVTTRSFSSSRSWAVNIFSLTPGRRSRSSAKRCEPNDRCQTIKTFHLPAKTFEVACTGHPKCSFIGSSLAYKIVRPSKTTNKLLDFTRFISTGILRCIHVCIVNLPLLSSRTERNVSGFPYESIRDIDVHLGTCRPDQRILRTAVWDGESVRARH